MMKEKSCSKLEVAIFCALTGILTAAVTQKLTKQNLLKAQEKIKLMDAKIEFDLRTVQNSKQVEEGKPIGSLKDGMKIDEIYVWELEDLKKRFPSDGEGIENVMNFHN